jgi:hypothetical protein
MTTNEAPAPAAASGDAPPTARRGILLVGIDPALVDFRSMPGLDTARMRTSRAAIDAELASLGLTVERCVLDLGETAEAKLTRALTEGDYDCVMIGAGVRVLPEHFLLFERVLNIVHRHAPRAAICFNTDPSDTVEAAKRGLALY